MAWLKLDDRFGIHSKIRPLSDRAFRLHVIGMLCAAGQLSDGHLTDYDVERCMVDANRATKKHLDELVEAGLWKPNGCGFEIHDYLEFNPSAERVKAERERWAEAKRKGRAA